jgi:hypothetical protein
MADFRLTRKALTIEACSRVKGASSPSRVLMYLLNAPTRTIVTSEYLGLKQRKVEERSVECTI